MNETLGPKTRWAKPVFHQTWYDTTYEHITIQIAKAQLRDEHRTTKGGQALPRSGWLDGHHHLKASSGVDYFVHPLTRRSYVSWSSWELHENLWDLFGCFMGILSKSHVWDSLMWLKHGYPLPLIHVQSTGKFRTMSRRTLSSSLGRAYCGEDEFTNDRHEISGVFDKWRLFDLQTVARQQLELARQRASLSQADSGLGQNLRYPLRMITAPPLFILKTKIGCSLGYNRSFDPLAGAR